MRLRCAGALRKTTQQQQRFVVTIFTIFYYSSWFIELASSHVLQNTFRHHCQWGKWVFKGNMGWEVGNMGNSSVTWRGVLISENPCWHGGAFPAWWTLPSPESRPWPAKMLVVWGHFRPMGWNQPRWHGTRIFFSFYNQRMALGPRNGDGFQSSAVYLPTVPSATSVKATKNDPIFLIQR